jgi:DNA (cytosine-5)-methyltransferase 1
MHEVAPNLTGADRHGVAKAMAVRRLTPRECERLQGFPDDYTLIPFRGKPASDGPRYKALGNSMAVPVMAWIGKRIEQVEALIAELDAVKGVNE